MIECSAIRPRWMRKRRPEPMKRIPIDFFLRTFRVCVAEDLSCRSAPSPYAFPRRDLFAGFDIRDRCRRARRGTRARGAFKSSSS